MECTGSVPDRIETTFFDRRGRTVDKDKAVTMLVSEYDANGRLLRQWLSDISQKEGESVRKKD